MKDVKSKMVKGAGVLASLAMITATISNSSTCAIIFHQPKFPSKLHEMKK